MKNVPVIVFEKKRGLFRQEFSEARVIRMLAESNADAVIAIGDDAATADLVAMATQAGLPRGPYSHFVKSRP